MVYTIFHVSEVPNEGLLCVCFSVVTIDSVMKKGGKYCSQVYLEECKYVFQENKMSKVIDVEFKLDSSDYSDGSDSK